MKTTLAFTLLVSSNIATVATGKPLIVEPFLAQWCAKQFPDQINDFNGYDMVQILGNHKKLEPFLGKWCFDQFSELGSLDENSAIESLYTKHEQIETYFQKWGDDSFATTNPSFLVDIEPYVGQWCAAQYPNEIKTKTKDLIASVQANHVKFEPALARWCFAQFPNQLSSLNADTVVQDLSSNHELVENELIKWVLSTTHTPKGMTRKEKGLLAGLLIFAIGFVSLLAAVVIMGRRRRTAGKDVEFGVENNQNAAQEEDSGATPAII